MIKFIDKNILYIMLFVFGSIFSGILIHSATCVPVHHEVLQKISTIDECRTYSVSVWDGCSQNDHLYTTICKNGKAKTEWDELNGKVIVRKSSETQ